MSEIDKLGRCSTDITLDDGFEVINYALYSVTRKAAPADHIVSDADHSIAEEAESLLRQDNHLVILDESRRRIWVFSHGHADSEDCLSTNKLVLSLAASDLTIHLEHHGKITALELCKCAQGCAGNPAPNSPAVSPKVTTLPVTPSARVFGTGTSAGQPHRARCGQESEDSPTLYARFIAAVIALVSFHLAKEVDTVFIGCRNFIVPQKYAPFLDEYCTQNMPSCHSVFSLKTYLTSAGTLVLSHAALKNWHAVRLNDLSHEQTQELRGRAIAHLAPGGVLVRIDNSLHGNDEQQRDGSSRRCRKRVKLDCSANEQWKNSVLTWLKWKGLNIPEAINATFWVRVQLLRHTTGDRKHPVHPWFLWPACMCLMLYSPTDSLRRSPSAVHEKLPFPAYSSRQATTAFSGSTQLSVQDNFPCLLKNAEKWFDEKPIRDRELDKAQKQRLENEMKLNLPDQEYISYNRHARRSVDIQTPGGIYPTPPDVPGTESFQTSSELGDNNESILSPALQNEAQSEKRAYPAQDYAIGKMLKEPDNPVRLGFQSSLDDGDLAHELDRDTFDVVGVTEADFDFFDEPSTGGKATDTDDEEVEDKLLQNEPAPSRTRNVSLLENSTNEHANHHKLKIRKVSVLPDMAPQQPSKSAFVQSPIAKTTDSTKPNPEGCVLLKPDTVLDKLFTPGSGNLTTANHTVSAVSHNRDIFSSVPFDAHVASSDAKYTSNGRFAYQSSHKWSSVNGLQGVPAGFGEDKGNKSLASLPAKGFSVETADSDSYISVYTDTPSPESYEEEEDTGCGLGTENDEAQRGLQLPSRALSTSGKDHISPLTSTADHISFVDSDGGSEVIKIQKEDTGLLRDLEPDYASWCISGLNRSLTSSNSTTHPSWSASMSDPEPAAAPADNKPTDGVAFECDGQTLCHSAQVLVNQMASTTLGHGWVDNLDPTSYPVEPATCLDRDTHGKIMTTLLDVFPNSRSCALDDYIAINEGLISTTCLGNLNRRNSCRSLNSTSTTGVSSSAAKTIFQMPLPHLTVRRTEALWNMLPTSLSFWDSLSLQPFAGAKNISALCLYPASAVFRDVVEDFLTDVTAAYEACKLGNHVNMSGFRGSTSSLIPFSSLSLDPGGEFGTILSHLRAWLADKSVHGQSLGDATDTTVLYVVAPSNEASCIWTICRNISHYFDWCWQELQGKTVAHAVPEVVLQILPYNVISSWSGPGSLHTNDFNNFARELYDRCPAGKGSSMIRISNMRTAPSFCLAELLPKSIPFRLTAEQPTELLYENTYLHIAYAHSSDSNWITAAWTDSSGARQGTAAYSRLAGRSFADIAREIWLSCLEIMQIHNISWRVVIACAGPIDGEELEAWATTVKSSGQKSVCGTVIVSLDTDHSVSLTPVDETTSLSAGDLAGIGGASFATTTSVKASQKAERGPAAGPTPAITPTGGSPNHDEMDETISDEAHDAWAVILGHRQNTALSLTENRPSLASGLLISRCGRQRNSVGPKAGRSPRGISDHIATATVNLLWLGSNTGKTPHTGTLHVPGSRGYDNILRDVLVLFGRLALLAELRGLREARAGLLPWHMVVANSGARALEQCCSCLIPS